MSGRRYSATDTEPLPCGCMVDMAEAWTLDGRRIPWVWEACPSEGWLRLVVAQQRGRFWQLTLGPEGGAIIPRLRLEHVVRCAGHPSVPCP